MEYIKLVLGIGLVIAFTWILLKNLKRSTIVSSLLRLETITLIIAGVYLVVSSVYDIIL